MHACSCAREIELMRVEHGKELQRERRVTAAMSQRLDRVRAMRDLLLASHQHTETQLGREADKAHSMLASMERDIDALHAHIERRRSVAARNEAVVDDFTRGVHLRVADLQVCLPYQALQ